MIDRIKPLTGRIIVLPDPPKEKTESGLIIPDSAKQAPSSGVVTHVSEGESTFKVNDHVLFTKNAGVELSTNPIHVLMRTEDIYAII